MQGRGTILVVSGDERLREALTEVLTAVGFRVRTAGGAEEARAGLSPGDAPGVLLVDLDGGEEAGLALLGEASGGPGEVMRVAVASDAALRERSLGAGAQVFLQKPLELEGLLRVLGARTDSPR